MKRTLFFFAWIPFIVSCQGDLSWLEESLLDPAAETVFIATLEGQSPLETKVHADSDLQLRWDIDDRIVIYNKTTVGKQYRYDGIPGEKSGTFSIVSSDETTVSGEQLEYIYSLYPYDENTAISNEGDIYIAFPHEQTYHKQPFGTSTNVMVSVSKNNLLLFKNVGGYLSFKLYGDAVSICRIDLRGNNNETLAGPATVSASIDGEPQVALTSGYGSKKTISLTCPEALNPTSNDAIEFWFALPPITFSKGFTITVTDIYGGTFVKSTSKSVTIARNTVSRMAPIRVVPCYDSCNEALQDMYTDIGKPCKMRNNPDDWACLLNLFCNDLEGADALIPDNNYNWFSICGNLSSRNTNYRNVSLRYSAPNSIISSANRTINGLNSSTSNPETLNQLAQAHALRGWSYLLLASAYQFNYQFAGSQPCLPLVTERTIDLSNNPRVSVQEIYAQIIADLDFAVDHLEGSTRTSKMYIDGNVAHGLRARAFLDMGEWQKAYDDAVKAAQGYTPATLAEVSKPAFYDLSEHNWIWGYDMTPALTQAGGNAMYANPSSWLRSFSGYSYSAACQVYTCINTMLWNQIPASDIRKQWWVDENLESTLLDGLKWPGFNDVAHANDGDTKLPYIPYTNVKFGCFTVGTTNNDEDMVLMRVEEMILIQAECQAHLGNDAQAIQILENFVKNYRNPQYSATASGRNLLDEIWFQRRVELWGEGFFVPDMHRLNKPLVRFHDNGKSTNMPAAFRFNLPADDPWLLMRFPDSATSLNSALVNNSGGHLPTTDENPSLRDGVTD